MPRHVPPTGHPDARFFPLVPRTPEDQATLTLRGLLHSQTLIPMARLVAWTEGPGGRFRILDRWLGVCKCLWKSLFSGHSYFRLKVAVWMLCDLETSQLHSVSQAGRIQTRGE
jgi:hypothetical protein